MFTTLDALFDDIPLRIVITLHDGRTHTCNLCDAFEAEYILHRLQHGAYVDVRRIARIDYLIDCPIHGWTRMSDLEACDACLQAEPHP